MQPVRLTKSNFEHLCVTELPVETLRSPMVKDERQVMKVSNLGLPTGNYACRLDVS